MRTIPALKRELRRLDKAHAQRLKLYTEGGPTRKSKESR